MILIIHLWGENGNDSTRLNQINIKPLNKNNKINWIGTFNEWLTGKHGNTFPCWNEKWVGGGGWNGGHVRPLKTPGAACGNRPDRHRQKDGHRRATVFIWPVLVRVYILLSVGLRTIHQSISFGKIARREKRQPGHWGGKVTLDGNIWDARFSVGDRG